jgi:hypothetical protein
MSTNIVFPVIEWRAVPGLVQLGVGPTATETFDVVGVVQPAGTCRDSCEPETKSLPVSEVKTKVSVLPVLAAVTVVGLTVILPLPLLASPSVNVVVAVPELRPVATTL